MGSVRPNGVKIVIAFLSLSVGVGLGCLALFLLVGQPPGILYINLLGSTIAVVGIVGLWRMKRWGLWLTIAISASSLVAGSYGLVTLMGQLSFVMRLPIFWRLLDLFFGIYGGPVQLIGYILIITYLYRVRRIFL